MRRIAAHYLFPVTRSPIRYGILELGESGRIHRVIDPRGDLVELPGMVFHSGLLVPGLIDIPDQEELAWLKAFLSRSSPDTGFAELRSTIKALPHSHQHSGLKQVIDQEAILEKLKKAAQNQKQSPFNQGLNEGLNEKQPPLEQFDEARNQEQSSFVQLLKGVTFEGARLLNMEQVMGSFQPGFKPGVNLVYPFDFSSFHLRHDSRIYPIT